MITTRISSVSDFKNRTMVESNTIKSFILSASGGFRNPTRDDILIHDYQMANSVTINSILSNYIVDLKYAWENYFNPANSQTESYFQIANGASEVQALGDSTRMFMYVSDGQGSFYSRKPEFNAVSARPPEGIIKYINLESVWYGVQEVVVTHEVTGDDGKTQLVPVQDSDGNYITAQHLVLAPEPMNNFAVNPNPYGKNPFDDEELGSLNQFLDKMAGEKLESVKIDCIVENLFYANRFVDEAVADRNDDSVAGLALPKSKYIVCAAHGLFGLIPTWNSQGKFSGMDIYDLGLAVKNMNHQKYSADRYDFTWCSFNVVSDLVTLFVVFQDSETGKSHYIYINGDSYDQTYGFPEVRLLVNDTLTTSPDNVFHRVESIKTLESLNIVLTDYGFWDIEPNQTMDVTYAFAGKKECGETQHSTYGWENKVVHPDFMEAEAGDSVVEYDKPWRRTGSMFEHIVNGQPRCSFPAQIAIADSVHPFVGATDEMDNFQWTGNFAVYNSTDDSPAYILAGITVQQFQQLLYSDPDLSSAFTRWLYDQVTDPGKGQYYIDGISASAGNVLWNQIQNGHRIASLDYQLTDGQVIKQHLRSVKDTILNWSSSAGTLQTYCSALNGLVSSDSLENGWLFDEDGLKNGIKRWFADSANQDGFDKAHKESLVNHLVDKAVSEFPLLGYFRNYLREYLGGSLLISEQNQTVDLDDATCRKIVNGVRDMIKSQVQTCLVLGDRTHPNINAYLYRNQAKLNKSDVQYVYSPLNVVSEITKGVASTPFFGEYLTWGAAWEHVSSDSDSVLFKMGQNGSFIDKSRYSRSGVLSLDWAAIKQWMFTDSGENLSDVKLLRQFVKTQFYRPLYFKASDHQTFTKDSRRYWCRTKKSYYSHTGDEHDIEWLGGQFGVVDKTRSGLGDSHIQNVSYSKITNVLTYEVHEDPIPVVDNKFVYDDVEFYAPRGENVQEITSIYFNEFQKDMASYARKVVIDQDGFFTIEHDYLTNFGDRADFNSVNNQTGAKYRYQVVDDNGGNAVVLKVDSTEVFDENSSDGHRYDEFRQEVVDGRFSIGGVWYILKKGPDGKYTGLEYAGVDDSLLRQVMVSSDGFAEFPNWGLTFQFEYVGANATVKVVKRVDAVAMDRVVEEWCEYDDRDISISSVQSFDWHLSNVVWNMIGQFGNRVSALGNGVLYEGGLLDTRCMFGIRHNLIDGFVESVLVLRKQIGDGPWTEQTYGTLLDYSMNVVPGKTFSGSLAPDNTIDESGSDCVFVLDQIGSPHNVCHAAWVKTATWNSNYKVETGVGTVGEADSEGKIQIVFNDEPDLPKYMTITPIQETLADGTRTTSYTISTTRNGKGDYLAKPMGDTLHAIVDGRRYRINLQQKTVDRLKFQEVEARTMDFATQYQPEKLKDAILQNVRQYMMNEIVHLVSSSNLAANGIISLNPRGMPLYLDMFSDEQSAQNLILANGLQVDVNLDDASTVKKFRQVFKNSVVDYENDELGNCWRYLDGKVSSVFTNGGSIYLNDLPSFTVERRANGQDVFSTQVLMDLHLNQSSKMMKELYQSGREQWDGKWVVGKAVIRNVKCVLEIVPRFKYDDNGNRMAYDVKYVIQQGSYPADVDGIVYNLYGKTRTRQVGNAIQEFTVQMSEISGALTPQLNLDNLVDANPIDGIIELVNQDAARSLMVLVNSSNALSAQSRLPVAMTESRNPVYQYGEFVSDGGTWELGTPVPQEALNEGAVISRGRAVIDGEMFTVDSTDSKIVSSIDPNKTMDIVSVVAHDDSSLETLRVARGKAVVSDAYLSSHFTVGKFEDTVYLKYKKSGEIPPLEQINATVNLAQLTNIDHYCQSIQDILNVGDGFFVKKTAAWNGSAITYTLEKYRLDDGGNHTDSSTQTYTTPPTVAYRQIQQDNSPRWPVDNGPAYPFVPETDDESQEVQQGIAESSYGPDLTSETQFDIDIGIDVKNDVKTYKIWDGNQYITSQLEGGGYISKTFSISGTDPVVVDGGWDGGAGEIQYKDTAGMTGQATVKFYNIEGDVNDETESNRPYAQISGTPVGARVIDLIPDGSVLSAYEDEVGSMVGETREYRPVQITRLSVERGEQRLDDSRSADLDDFYSIRFRFSMKMDVRQQEYVVKTSTQYVTGNYLVSGSGVVEPVIAMMDYNGNSVERLTDAWAQIPVNLEGSSVTPVESRTSRFLYFKLTQSATPSIAAGGGYYAPCSVQVVPPGQNMQKEGDIYDRHYTVVRQVFSDHAQFGDEQAAEHGKFWLDKSATLKSSRLQNNNTDYQRLWDGIVPTYLSDGIQELEEQSRKVDRNYFTLVMTQLKQMLQMIQDELNAPISQEQILGTCRFKFDDTVRFNQTQIKGILLGTATSGSAAYGECLADFNNHLRNQFVDDFGRFNDNQSIDLNARDYHHILLSKYSDLASIFDLKNLTIDELYYALNQAPQPGDVIMSVFNSESEGSETDGTLARRIRYINSIQTTLNGDIFGMFVADGHCNLFSRSGARVMWHRFNSNKYHSESLVQSRVGSSSTDFAFEPQVQLMEYPISDDGWTFKSANRNLSGTPSINDAFCVHFADGSTDMWYLNRGSIYLWASGYGIRDVAYEQDSDCIYVLFTGDNHLYRFNNPSASEDSRHRVLLVKENADMKIETFVTAQIDPDPSDSNDMVFIDYDSESEWKMLVYGRVGGTPFVETISGSPGARQARRFNNIVFGDTLFTEEQLKFQNVSKNKEMFDILDIYEVDGCYYGLFKNGDTGDSESRYTIFKTSDEGGVVRRLPWNIIHPSMIRTADDIYSLYVVAIDTDGSTYLQEISVPDEDLYVDRRIPLEDIVVDSNANQGIEKGELGVTQVIMDDFRPGRMNTHFFMLSNAGLTRIQYRVNVKPLSIDRISDFREVLSDALGKTTLGQHLSEMHEGDGFFDVIGRKVNQFGKDFNLLELVPVEFDQTQDIGVIPDSKVDDTDGSGDHRVDSVQVSTDIVYADGMFATTDTNPGIVTAAVSNPATTYDDDSVFVKSQRNPSIEGTEFYDYIYDSSGTALMDLYQIPFIYQVNSNNTYDIWINVPTTRTKYLNRVAGTLKPDLTSQVLKDDSRDRVNFMGESLPNNLDESTTRLRVYMDRKFISIGNVELVEISGNSIPLQIYRDSANDGLYDSIALESRWNGEVVEINEPEKDIHKVMLEFECYGTDSQSIHIQGKTLIHHSLDDRRYRFG